MSTYEISKSSLLSLKVEILKKQEEINKSKLENKTFIPSGSNQGKKGPKLAKNKGVDERGEKDYEEDPDLLKKSRQMLEAKSKLYDKLSNKTSDFEENKHYLVNFNKKSIKNSNLNDICPNFDNDPDDIDNYPNSPENTESYNDADVDSEDEWTEYTDALGRTRTCLKKDLNYMKNKDQRIIGEHRSEINNEPKVDSEIKKKGDEFNEKSELLSSDMKRELLRQQWEKDEAAIANKDNVHYQDVLFDEARTHGVGYFAFSKDETERAKQQTELEKLRRETAQKQKEAQELKKTRESLLKNRIRAAQNRKRARLGLPPIESDEETDKPEDNEVPTSAEAKELTAEEQERELKRQQHIRPWDIGKEGVKTSKEHYIYSQEEWVAKKREERIDEFAPPKNNKRNDQKRLNTNEFRNNKKLRTQPKDGATINPYKTTNSSSDSSSDEDDRLMQTYKQHNTSLTNKIPQKVPSSSKPPISIDTTPKDTSTTKITPDLRARPFMATPIVNELLYSPTQSSDESSSDDGDRLPSLRPTDGRFAQIPFEYGKNVKRQRGGDNMADSIMMGLKYLREQAESKGKLNRGDDDLMG